MVRAERKFDGKTYYMIRPYDHKGHALALARKYRARGIRARVTMEWAEKQGSIPAHFWWAVWVDKFITPSRLFKGSRGGR